MKYSKNFYQIRSNEVIFDQVKDEIKSIGYYTLPYQDTSKIKEYANSIDKKNIAVVGIGGSSLGAFAIYKFLKKLYNFDKFLHFFESTDPMDINSKLQKIDKNDTHFMIISKSGTTIETISIFKYLSSIIKIDKTNCTIISEEDSKLTAYAKKMDIKTFAIPKNVSGRFSVFSSVGLLPLAAIGVDIDKLLEGAREIKENFFSKKEQYDILMQKARFLVENKYRFNLNVIFSYSTALEGFNKWYMQLWGESLGKKNINNTKQALTPLALIGPIDQHSFLQLIVDGRRDKTITFIKIENFEDEIIIPPNTLKGFDDLEYIEGISFSKLIDEQANATIDTIKDLKDIPCDVITIDKVDESSIAKLMFSYQLLVSIIGRFLQINTYDQPGVEAGKRLLKERLANRA